MRKDQIKVGGHYKARISGNFVIVKVERIRQRDGYSTLRDRTVYDVLNLKTGRRTTFDSAAKFRSEVPDPNTKGKTPASVRFKGGEEEDPMAQTEKFRVGDRVRFIGPVYHADGSPIVGCLGTVLARGHQFRNFKTGEEGTLATVQFDGADRPSNVSENRIELVEGENSADPTSETMNSTPDTASKGAEGEHSSDPTELSATDKPTRTGTTTSGGCATDCPRCGSPVTIANGRYDYHRHPQKGITCGMSGEKQTAPYHQCECREPETRPQGRQILCLKCGGERVDPPFVPSGEVPTVVTAPKPRTEVAGSKPIPNVGINDSGRMVTEPTGLLSNLRHVEDTAPHVIVQARAGTGKTTTLVSGLQVLMGETPTDARGNAITPSPQQQEVWDALAQSRGKVRTVGFVAFNRSIAAELKTRVPAGCDACTMHSLGLRAVTKSLGRLEISDSVVPDLIAELVGMDIYRLRKEQPVLLKATEQLVSLCKMNLTGTGYGNWDEDLSRLSAHYDVELENQKRAVFDLVPRVLDRCRDPKRQGRINYDDMIWLPVVLDLPVYRYDLLLVDEAQDLNRCQQALAKRAGKRLILCGDERQAIYGFAGADSESMPRMARELSRVDPVSSGCNVVLANDGRGCITLPLTVTRRCGKLVVEEARRYVPDFSAHESNPDGEVRDALYPRYKTSEGMRERLWEQTYGPAVREGDMVLCRTNAPLVSECFRFLRRGIRANIQGRDIGQGLIALVKRLAKGTDGTVPGLVTALSKWLAAEQAKERAKKTPSEAKLTSLQDRHDCILCFTEGVNSVEEVIARIEDLFTDAKDRPGVRFSSVHKAKGLEAENVFILFPPDSGPRTDRMQPWERVQENNIRYVAITRAVRVLTYVS